MTKQILFSMFVGIKNIEMKYIKRIVWLIFALILLLIIGLKLTGYDYILKAAKVIYPQGHITAFIDDSRFFPVRKIKNGKIWEWPEHKYFNKIKPTDSLLEEHKKMKTVAFLIIKNDSLFSENYYRGYHKDSLSNSFSMAKSFLATCIGVAIDEGKIHSADQKVSDFLPWFNTGKLNQQLTIKDLLTMSSGIDYGESYSNPFGFQAKAYYGHDLRSLVKNYEVKKEPGTLWKYEGGNSILLGMILEKATGKTVSDYFSEKIWSKIGTSQSAFWNLDDEGGMEKTFSAIYSNARDFARMGKLYLNRGKWNSENLVSSSYINQSLTPVNIKNKEGETVDYYGFHYWLGNYHGKKFFGPRGMRGQYIIVIPDDNLIIVRLGHERPKTRKNHLSTDTFDYIDEAYRLIDKN